MMVFIRHINVEKGDLGHKQRLVKQIENSGFYCKFVPNGVDIYANRVDVYEKLLQVFVWGSLVVAMILLLAELWRV